MSGKQKMSAMLKVLKAENAVLDSILVRQAAIHDTVAAKDWIDLENSMKKMDRLSSRFMELEDKRMNLEMETAVKMRGLDKQSENLENENLETENSSPDMNAANGIVASVEVVENKAKSDSVKAESEVNPYAVIFFAKASNDIIDDDNTKKEAEKTLSKEDVVSDKESSEENSDKEPLVLTYEERAFLYGEKKVSDVFSQVRTKLARSKIENNALRVYVAAANGFLQGVLDKIVPQRRNTVYNKYGKMAKPNVQSLVIDKVF
ncbi:MAG: hypothetical protein K6F69_01975 [Treponema sp.]|nr:hypothetical protein [Treponema sp.]